MAGGAAPFSALREPSLAHETPQQLTRTVPLEGRQRAYDRVGQRTSGRGIEDHLFDASIWSDDTEGVVRAAPSSMLNKQARVAEAPQPCPCLDAIDSEDVPRAGIGDTPVAHHGEQEEAATLA